MRSRSLKADANGITLLESVISRLESFPFLPLTNKPQFAGNKADAQIKSIPQKSPAYDFISAESFL